MNSIPPTKKWVESQCKLEDYLDDRMQEIGGLLKTQDNRITDNPIFIVQTKRRIYGMDTDYSDDYEWVTEDECEPVEPELAKELEEKYNNGEDTDDYIRTAYVDVWEFKTACLTEKGAQDYINRMAHRLNEPRIYVESGYRNDEWRDVRNYLKQLDVK